MSYWAYILPAIGAVVAVVMATGWWRRVFWLFAIRSRLMTVARRELRITSAADVDRINVLLRSFAGGFNAMITSSTYARAQAHCDSLPSLYQPFAQEGLAMGYTLRHLFRYHPEKFEEQVVKPRPEFRYLYYVGLGFWSGMRNHDARRLAGVVEGLDPMHGYLCYDGYGFKHGFFDFLSDPGSLKRIDALEGYARNTSYQGVGRAFFFLFMGEPQTLIEHVRKLGSHANDLAAGVGLAAAFINPDRLQEACRMGNELPSEWHDHFHLGMCFGLKARALSGLEEFDRHVSRLETGVQEAVFASIRECDRVELLTRSDGLKEGYRRWREQVTEWMTEHIEYPMAGLKSATSSRVATAPASR